MQNLSSLVTKQIWEAAKTMGFCCCGDYNALSPFIFTIFIYYDVCLLAATISFQL
jgi:hypothetical protein